MLDAIFRLFDFVFYLIVAVVSSGVAFLFWGVVVLFGIGALVRVFDTSDRSRSWYVSWGILILVALLILWSER